MSAQNISLNGLNLQSTSIITQKFTHEGIGTDQAKVKIPHRSGEKLTSYTYSSRSVTLEGHIVSTTSSGLDSLVDTFKQYLVGSLAVPLTYDYNGTTRQYTVNVNNVSVARDYYNTTMVPFTINCEAINPPFAQSNFTGTAYNVTTVSGTFYTSTSGIINNSNITVSGTINPTPTITFTINTVGSMTSFDFQNTTTNTGFSFIPTTFSGISLVSINTNNYTVTQNGNSVTTYSGVFPTFTAGNNNFTLNVRGATPNYSYGLSISYVPLWL